MRKVNWDEITENEGGEFARPTPGGYIVRIVDVEDVEEKEYLRINWDFIDGEFRGYNADTFNRAGFWPAALFRSYKPNALPFFKAFKTALEVSNRGYIFREDRLSDMHDKLFGVVLGEEEYTGNDGTVKTRLYVAQTRSTKAIKDGDFTVPKPKKLATTTTASQYQQRAAAPAATAYSSSPAPFGDLMEPNGDLPF